jgi:2-polyprenyl-6-methoxyphenol hydroxylase-like FAD-dependent oxidoreductase
VSSGNSRVTGVRVGSETLTADLVVDSTGRGSHSPQWLASMGYAKPPEERVEVALAYTTRFFRRCPEDLDGDSAAIVPPTPEGKRGGIMLAQEGNRWTLTLIGHFGQAAPTELDGFIEYARTLPAPFIYDVIRKAEPLGNPMSARFPASIRRRYEKLDRFPEGYLVFGDAISSFNPIYGQGMSVAALEAVQLAETLAGGSDNLATRFFRRASKVVDIPWAVPVGNDLRMKETVGPRNAGVNIINWYLSKLHKAAHHDPVPALAFHRVGNLLEPPPSECIRA